jgi:phosphopantetheinyl transferase
MSNWSITASNSAEGAWCHFGVSLIRDYSIGETLHRESSWPSWSSILGLMYSGKQAMPTLDPFISFNISHDGSLVAMAWDEGDRNEIENVGMDVMKVSLPRGESVQSFIRALAEQVGAAMT